MAISAERLAELLAEQEEAISNIFTLYDDFVKSNKDRRSKPEYYTKIRTGLDNWYNTLTLNNLVLKSVEDKSHEYFVRDCYEITKKKYVKALELIKQYSHVAIEFDLQSSTSTPQSTNPQEKQETIPLATAPPETELLPRVPQSIQPNIAKEQEKKDRITKLIRRHKSKIQMIRSTIARIMTDDYETADEIEYAINTLQVKSDEFAVLHSEIYSMAGLTELEEFNFNDFNELDLDVSRVIQQLIRRKSKMSKSLNSTMHDKSGWSNFATDFVQLPKMDIPDFDGELRNWPKFRDLFIDLIHTSNLSETYKFNFLKAKLVGNAKGMISTTNTNKDNYEAAWQRIMVKYNNKKAVVFDTYDRLFNQKPVKENSSSALHDFINISMECISILNVYDISFETGESAILFLLLAKLDQQTRLSYELSLKEPKEIPKLEDFFQFLELRAHALQNCSKSSIIKAMNHVSTEMKPNEKCICCNEGSHKLRDCIKFKALSIQNRKIFVKEKGLCFNCMRSGHLVQSCQWNGCPIPGCLSKHNSMLHQKSIPREVSKMETANDASNIAQNVGDVSFNQDNNNCNNASSSLKEDKFIFLGTALVYVDDKKRNKILCRALLDSGSQVNIMTKDMWKKLGLKSKQLNTTLDGIGRNSITSSSRVIFNLFSTNMKFNQSVEALVLPRITSYLPSESINISTSTRDSYNLADPEFNCPDSIDILLGAEVCMEILQTHKISLGEGLPFMSETKLGWVVTGKYMRSKQQSSAVCGVTAEEENFQMNAPTLWELEDTQIDRQHTTIEEEMAELHFKTTTLRNVEGKFVVSLPKFKDIILGKSFDMALRRFRYLEKRFQKDPNLFTDYKNFLDEYLALNHMEEIAYENISKIHCFLPHHPVIKTSSSTTKLRVVFDASSKTSNNVSLNDILLKGPNIQDDVSVILLKFRLHKFALCADIEKMYRQILLKENDQHLQLIIWRDNSSQNFKFFKLKTVTYGTTSAPFLATRCLDELARQNQDRYPKASKIIQTNFYVDDLVTGFDDLGEAKLVQKDIIDILQSAGLHLRKWWSNHTFLIESLPSSDREMSIDFKNNQEYVKTLGVKWNPYTDRIMLSIPILEQTSVFTKRIISAESGQIFDPLGIVNPSVVIAKLMIQKLWVLKIDWDSPLPTDINHSWSSFRSQIPLLEKVSVTRFVLSEGYQTIQLHGFADASKQAYGAVVYIRSIDKHGKIHVKLFCSKSKVSPVSQFKCKDSSECTIPKLELSAAKLLSELVDKLKTNLPVKFDATYLWSDSKIVLCWLKRNPSSFTRFVCNRIKAIQGLTDINEWHHIAGDNNPADIISRGMLPKDLIKSTLWFDGPQFLQMNESDWPLEENLDSCEFDNKSYHSLTISKQNTENILGEINHRNSFSFLVRVIGYMIRFCKSTRAKASKSISSFICRDIEPLSATELSLSEAQIFRMLQKQFNMHKEITTSFKRLSPFIDNQGIIRVGGRLSNSSLPYETKHPILLPYCLITTLLITKIHCDNKHAAPLSLLAITREKYWPVNGARLCSKIFRHCTFCFRSKPHDIHQLMGQLPASRVTPSTPFAHTGVDFAGPFTIHHCVRGKKPTKVYLAVFICFTIKAVHLELVSELSTAAFLAAFKRFISRRGRPSNMYSDNATNFIGAKNDLMELHAFFQVNAKLFIEFAASKGIHWETIPPRSPHFGGLWEAGVRRAKYHLTAILKSYKFTYEELNTVIIEIEYILNSRPLTSIPNNPNDLCALTPNHFLIQGNCAGLDEKDIRDRPNHYLKRFEGITKVRQEFWSRFTKEYLVSLQQKTKWFEQLDNIKENMPVLLKDSCLYPLQWKMGIIQKVFKGSDDNVRVVDVRTTKGVFRRAISQISPFPDINTFYSELDSIQNQSIINSETPHCTTVDKSTKNITTPRQSSKRLTRFNLTLTIIYTLLVLPLIFGTKTNITRFPHHPGLYFDGISKVNVVVNRWHIITYFNVTDHFKQFSNFSSIFESIKPLCDEYSCKSTINQLENRINEIAEMNELLRDECQLKEVMRTNMLSRRRRSAIFPQLNVLGNIANAFTGVLDHSYAEKMEKVITNIRYNEEHQLKLLKNHTLILDNTVNIIKENNMKIMEKFQSLQNELQLIHCIQNRTTRKTHFNTLTNYLTLGIMRYREVQLQLHKSLTEFKGGRLNAVLINPRELQKHLVTIQDRLIQFKLPSTNLAELEPVTQVALTHGTDCLLFHIELPLVHHDDFNLYRMIPVPTHRKQVFIFISPIVDYLAINLKRGEYYLMSTSEFQRCVDFLNLKMCYEHQPVFPTDKDNHCEVNMFLHNYDAKNMCNIQYGMYPQYWIELRRMNHWLYAVKDKTLVKTICSDTTYEFEVNSLEGEGIVNIPPGCTLDIDGVKIHGKTISQSELIMKRIPPMLPFMNLSDEIPKANQSNIMVLKLNDLSSVSTQIKGLRTEESVTNAPVYEFGDGVDIHTWITYGLFVTFLSIGICYMFIRRFCLKKATTVLTNIIPQTENQREAVNGGSFRLPEGFQNQ